MTLLSSLDSRSRTILQHIVESYLETGNPVGSNTLSKKISPSLASATIRNVMSDLEGLNLLKSPHVSAGRIPTETGLKLFIDGLLQIGDISGDEKNSIEALSVGTGKSLKNILNETSVALSGLSNCVSFVIAPTYERALKHIEFVPIDNDKALVVIIDVFGLVENRIIDVPKGTPLVNLIEASKDLGLNRIKTFFKVIIFSIIILFIYLTILNQSLFQVSIRSVAFNVISILTGTGYVTKDFDQWGNFPLIFFLILMFIGGCAGSTTCGVKIFRIQILYKFIINQLKKVIYPRGIFIIKYENNTVNDKFLASIISFIYLYIIIFFVLTALLSLTGLDFVTSISGAATSISNVGPGLGSTIGPNGNFYQLPDVSKWILSTGMILGRLELFAILVLFLPSFWRS